MTKAGNGDFGAISKIDPLLMGLLGFHGRMVSKREVSLTMWWMAPLSKMKVRRSDGVVGGEVDPKRAQIRPSLGGFQELRHVTMF